MSQTLQLLRAFATLVNAVSVKYPVFTAVWQLWETQSVQCPFLHFEEGPSLSIKQMPQPKSEQARLLCSPTQGLMAPSAVGLLVVFLLQAALALNPEDPNVCSHWER